MRRAVVGICAAVHPAHWTIWRDVEANVSQRTYSLAVGDAGGLPVLLPPDRTVAQEPDQLLDLLDALLLAGGQDIGPSLYGASAEQETQQPNAERDLFEAALARRALERDLPVLGVCRGMQLLNVVRGGTLEQHIAGSAIHLHTPGAFSDHEVRFEPGSLVERIVARERAAVRSHHHQGIGRLGEGVAPTAWSEPDGLIEAIEIPERRYALGVLWHPEEDVRSRVIASLVDAARVGATA